MSIKIGNTNVLEVSYPGGDVDLVYYLKDSQQQLIWARPFNISKFNELNNPLPYGQTAQIVGTRSWSLKTPLYTDRDNGYYYYGDVLNVTNKITTAGYLVSADKETATFKIGEYSYNASYSRQAEGLSTVKLSGLYFTSTKVTNWTGNTSITARSPYQIKTTQSANIQVRGYDNRENLAYWTDSIKLELTYYDGGIKTASTTVNNRTVFSDTYLFNLSNWDSNNKYFISATPVFTNFRHCYVEEGKDLNKMTNASGEEHTLSLVTRSPNATWTISKGKGIKAATATIKRGAISKQLGTISDLNWNSATSSIGSFTNSYPLDTLTTTNTPLPGYKAAVNYNGTSIGRSMNNITIISPGPYTYTWTINSNQYVQKFRYQLTRGNVARENGVTVGLNKLGNTTLTVADPLYYNDSYHLSEYTVDTGCSGSVTSGKGTVTGNIVTTINATPIVRTLSIVTYAGVSGYELSVYRGDLAQKMGLDNIWYDDSGDTDWDVYYGDHYILDYITPDTGYQPIYPANAEGDIEYSDVTVEVKAEQDKPVQAPTYTHGSTGTYEIATDEWKNSWTFYLNNPNNYPMTISNGSVECLNGYNTGMVVPNSFTIPAHGRSALIQAWSSFERHDTLAVSFNWQCHGKSGVWRRSQKI